MIVSEQLIERRSSPLLSCGLAIDVFCVVPTFGVPFFLVVAVSPFGRRRLLACRG